MSAGSASLRAAVLGSPIGHSRSPELHTAAYRYLGLEVDYRRCEVTPETLDLLLAELADSPRGRRWLGFSVTMPMKAELAHRVGRVSTQVAQLGVLNTVVFDGAEAPDPSRAWGENTDVDGIVRALGEAGAAGSGGHPRRLGLIGAGATATAGLAAAAELGSPAVSVYARSATRAEQLRPLSEALGTELTVRRLDQLPVDLREGLLGAVVSTLPPGAADGVAEALRHSGAGSLPPLLDVAYDPWPSALAVAWESAGGAAVNGLVMLLHQAVEQVRLFTRGTERPAESLRPGEHAQMVAAMRAAVGLSSPSTPCSSPSAH